MNLNLFLSTFHVLKFHHTRVCVYVSKVLCVLCRLVLYLLSPTCYFFPKRLVYFYFLCVKVLPSCLYALYAYVRGTCGGQKWVLDHLELELGYELWHECWELNSGPLKEQPVLYQVISPTLFLLLLRSASCSGSHYIEHAGLKVTKVSLTQPPECLD